MTRATKDATLDGLDEEYARDAGAEPSAAEEVRRLAEMDLLTYDREREAAAERLGVRVTTLDAEVKRARPERDAPDQSQGRALALPEPEPWPGPVDGAKLLDRIAAELRRYLALPEHAAEACALWAVHSHVFDAGQVTPRLGIVSPEKRCGKTTLLMILGRLVTRPLPAANVTPAATFRTIEKARPTLLVDEADTFLGGSDELRGILNSGHNRGSAYVVRTVGDDHEPRLFSTWAPVALAAIGKLPGTLMDRSIVIRMRRRAPGEPVERLRLDRCDALDELARKAARWAADHLNDVARADPDAPAELHDRAADNWRPLLAIADLAGGGWPAKARAAAKALGGDDEASEESARVQLLADLRDLFAENEDKPLWSIDICAALARMEERPWPEWKTGKPITARQLASLLKPFGVVPSTVRTGDKTAKGYRAEQFADAFARYLPDQSVTPSHASETAASGDSSSVTSGSDVTDRDHPNPNASAGCDGVTDRNGTGPEREASSDRCDYCGDPDYGYAPLKAYGDTAKGGSRMHISCRWQWLRDRRAEAEGRAAVQDEDGDAPPF